MVKRHNIVKDTLILGFAIFSMYFGAGNIIFPPYLGLTSSSGWDMSFLSYFLADMGFATIAMFAILKVDGNVDNLTHKLGKVSGILLMSAIILCIGPLIALPRTGATTYEMLIVPTFGSSLTNSMVTSIFYYGLIMFFTFKPVTMIEILGKVLTPILFLALMVLIIKGIITPIGDIKENTDNANLFFDGLILGYQTLDVLAALAFGIIILKMVKQRGYESRATGFKIVGVASVIAALGIMLVYLGLTYLGATTSSFYSDNIEKAVLLNNIINHLLGDYGNLILGVVIFLACFTTGAALVSVTSEYFSKLSNRKISYETLVVIVTLYSIVATNFGLEQIINFAVPILTVVYPAAIVLVILVLIGIKNNNVYKFAAFSAMLYSLLEVLSKGGEFASYFTYLPLSNEGLGWFIPALVFAFIGSLFKAKEVNIK